MDRTGQWAARRQGATLDAAAFAQGFVEGSFPAFGFDGRTEGFAEKLSAAVHLGPGAVEAGSRKLVTEGVLAGVAEVSS